jgi:hypothetical protein
MKKGITIVAILVGLITPLTTPNANAQIISTITSAVKGASQAAQYTQTILALQTLVEDMVCVKGRFDAKFNAGINVNNCLYSVKIKLINVQYTMVYSQALGAGVSMLTSTNGPTIMSDMLRDIQNVTDAMKNLIGESDNETTEALLNKQDAKDYSSVLATSF